LVQINNIHANTFHFVVKKIIKIGPVEAEIPLLNLKTEEITESKIYSPVGKFAERVK